MVHSQRRRATSTAMVCSSSTTRDLLHGALLLVEQLRFLNELNAGTMAPRRRDDDDDMVSLSRASRGVASTRPPLDGGSGGE
jgi:hypothetical protein